MKLNLKLLLALTLVAPCATFAQDKTANQYANEGNAFAREKNYQEALSSFEEAIKLWGDSADAGIIYNAADCAKKTNQMEKAIEFYQKSIEKDYKVDYSNYFIAEIYGKQGKVEERIALLEETFPKATDEKVKSFMQKGLVKEYRKNAMAFYNEGNKILGECQTAKPEQYAEIQKRAKEQFKQAQPWVDKALTVSPDDPTLKQISNNIKEQLK